MKINLNNLKDLASKASPGPWRIGHVDEDSDRVEIESSHGLPVAIVPIRYNQSYICSVDPQTLLKLIKLIESYEEQIIIRSKRSHYQWDEGFGHYTNEDWMKEGSVSAMNILLSEFISQRKEILGE